MAVEVFHEAPVLAARMRMSAAAHHAEARLDAAVADTQLDDAVRLDDESRAAVAAMLDAAVRHAADAIAAGARRLLSGNATAISALADVSEVAVALVGSGHLAERELMRAVLAEARLSVLEPALVGVRAPDEVPLLLPRLADHRDPIVRDRATAFLLADSRRRRDAAHPPELPAEVERRLAWLVAAALTCDAAALGSGVEPAVIAATRRHLSARNEDRGADAAAMRLAAALDVPLAETGTALIDTLVEGRLRLFAAMVAHVTRVDYSEALAATIDPDAATLLTLLRSAGVPRDDLARIGLRLADADRMRDADMLPDAVDAAGALTVEEAREAIAPLTFDRDFRAAQRIWTRR